MADRRQTLAKLGPFQNLPESHLDFLAEIGEKVNFAPNQAVCEEGQPATGFYLVLDGRVAVEIYGDPRGAITIDTLDAGDVLGWSWIIPPHNWRFYGRAVNHVETLYFEGDTIRKRCDEDHEFGYHLHRAFNQILAQRLEGARIQLLDIHG